MIKVLSGTIKVQNFDELNFNTIKEKPEERQKPFHEWEYVEGQYTWLSEYSFGIHRLVNLHPEVTLCLQAYYHNEDTTEYFTFVDKKEEEGKDPRTLNEFYPQNDWENYINLVETKKDYIISDL